jgi:hypothetical protein
MQFDVIVGNPPYQISTDGFGTQARPIYQHFEGVPKRRVGVAPELVQASQAKRASTRRSVLVCTRSSASVAARHDLKNAMIRCAGSTGAPSRIKVRAAAG